MSLVWVKTGAGREVLVDTGKIPVTKSGKHSVYVRPEHLSAKARRALKIQLGVDIDSESSLRRYMKDHDLRFVDRGEKVDKDGKTRKEWIKDTRPGERGRNPTAKSHGYSHW